MTKYVLILFAAILGLGVFAVASPDAALAQGSDQLFTECRGLDPTAPTTPELCRVAGDASDPEDAGLFGPGSLLDRITQIVIFITGGISVLMVVVGGLRYVLSNGDPQGISSAKNTILYAIIGLVIALMAEAILVFVLRRL